VQELEEKINRLEAVLHSLGRRVEDHISEHDLSATKHPPYAPLGLTPRSDFPRSYADSTLQQSPAVESPWTTQSASYVREPQSRATLSFPTPSVIDTESLTVDERPSKLARPRAYTASTTAIALPSHDSSDLPPYDLVYSLTDLFFKHVNPWSPVLDRKSTFDVLFGGGNLSSLDANEQVLVHAIVATTLRFSRDPRLTGAARQQYKANARSRILPHVVSNPTIQSLQALLILTIDVVGTAHCPQGLNLIALLARNVLQLEMGIEKSVYLSTPSYPALSGLHAFSQSRPSSWIEDEGRRRLVWMVYILDRYSTVSDCSTFVIPDAAIDRRLPTTYDLFSRNDPVETRWPRSNHHVQAASPDTNLGSFSYHCEAITILSKIHNFLKSPIDLSSAQDFADWRSTYQSLDSELNTWLQSLPGEYGNISQLCHSDPGSKISNWIMLHAAFVTGVIRLHSAAAYPTISSTTASLSQFRPSFNAMQRCLGAVESLREIAQDTISNNMLDLLGPPFAFSLWTSARLLIVHAATMDYEVDPKIRFFISTLQSMGTYWEIASTYAETLTRVVTEGQQNAHSFAGNNIANSSTARSFKDMRKTAYELSLLLNQRQVGANATTARVHTPAANELEYLDVFDFFNYPLIATAAPKSYGASNPRWPPEASNGQTLQSPHFAMPSRESDWLNFQPPHE
jgi:hypothetical protein